MPVAAAVLAARWWSRAVLARLAEVALDGLALLTAVHQAAVAMCHWRVVRRLQDRLVL